MSLAIDDYLDRVMAWANRNEAEAPQVRAELEDHLLAKVESLCAEGASREDAIFAALKQHGDARKVGYGLREKCPLVDVRMHGTARGVIAIGPRAVGVFAFGGGAVGVVAVGGVAVGVVGIGGATLSLLLAFGGLSIAPLGLAFGGAAFGLMAFGGLAVGAAAHGGVAAGLVAQGNQASHGLWALEDAPRWLQWLASMVPVIGPGRGMLALHAVSWSLIAAVIYAQVSLAEREKKRLKRCGIDVAVQ